MGQLMVRAGSYVQAVKNILSLLTWKHIALAIATGLSLLISGCASYPPDTCTQFEERRKETDYTTQYRFSESATKSSAPNFKPLPKGVEASVALYKIQTNAPEIQPCNHLVLRKELYLQRSTHPNLVIEETRELYAANGALIATKNEIMNQQLRTDGHYSANVPLPIPESAPPGKYRIVSKLLLKTKKNKTGTLLAKTSVSFQVVPR